MALLLIVFWLIAAMTSLRHITLVVAKTPATRANAVIVATGLALLVAIGGPKLYEVLRFGDAAEVSTGAESVAASLVASALFYAFSSPADTELRAELRAETDRADRAEEALAAELKRQTAVATPSRCVSCWRRAADWLKQKGQTTG